MWTFFLPFRGGWGNKHWNDHSSPHTGTLLLECLKMIQGSTCKLEQQDPMPFYLPRRKDKSMKIAN